MTAVQTSILKRPHLRKKFCGQWMAIATRDPLVLRCLECEDEIEPEVDQ